MKYYLITQANDWEGQVLAFPLELGYIYAASKRQALSVYAKEAKMPKKMFTATLQK